MLKFRKLAYRPWPVCVTFQVCDEATGTVTEIEQVFIAHFTPFTEDDLLKARRESFGDEADTDTQALLDAMPVAEHARLEAGFIARLLCGWSQVADEAGTPLRYSATALADLCTGLDGAAFRRGFNRAISEIRFGVAPAKNAETSPPPGPTPAPGEVASTS